MNTDTGTLHRRGLARGLKIFLDIIFFLILLVGILLIGSLPISMSSGYDDGWDLSIPVTIGETSIIPRLPIEITQESPAVFEAPRIAYGTGQLRLFHHHLPLHLLNAALYLCIFVVLLWGIRLLRQILATTAGGRPFDPSNPRRLNILGWLILSASLSASLLQYLASRWALSQITVLTVPVSPLIRFSQEWIVCGLLVLVLAAIWKEAVRMAEEQSLTV